MKIYTVIAFFAVVSATVLSFAGIAATAEIQIPRSVPGDKGKYFLLEMQKNGDIVTALHKRVGVDSVGYTKTETNCATMQMRELGYSEESPTAIKENPTKWFDLEPGSSKSDLANFVCKN
uniref:hypothetical protein n=1 Tax=Candidatus Electronema sp. TaxID=2698783 RepID=UPI0040577D0F